MILKIIRITVVLISIIIVTKFSPRYSPFQDINIHPNVLPSPPLPSSVHLPKLSPPPFYSSSTLLPLPPSFPSFPPNLPLIYPWNHHLPSHSNSPPLFFLFSFSLSILPSIPCLPYLPSSLFFIFSLSSDSFQCPSLLSCPFPESLPFNLFFPSQSYSTRKRKRVE